MDIVALIRRMTGPNRISVRLADGWYPSSQDAAGVVHHDRHVLIWVRQYESMLVEAANEIERLRGESAD